MKLLLLAVMVVGLLGPTTAEDNDLSLLKRLLSALKERETRNQEVALEKRTSYGIRWNGTDKTISVYLQRVTNCNDKCFYDIKFTSKGGKDDQALNKEYLDLPFKYKYVFTESDLLDSAIASNRLTKLPSVVLVEVCMEDREGKRACNMRDVDTTLDKDNVFHKTYPGYGKGNEGKNTENKNDIVRRPPSG